MRPRWSCGSRERRPPPATLHGALQEDRVAPARTSRALFPRPVPARAGVVAQAPGVVSGVAIARELARQRGVSARARVRDGARVHAGQEVVTLSGDLRRILGVERTL